MRAVLALLATAVLLPACEVSAGPDDGADEAAAGGTRGMMAASEVDSIARTVRAAIAATFATGPAAASAMPGYYTPDAVLSDETEQTHAGHAAITRNFAAGFPEGTSLQIRSQGVIGSGDLVVDMGTYTFSMPNPQGGPATAMNGRYLVVLQRMADGSWKIVRQIGDVVGIGGALPATPDTTGSTLPRADTAARRDPPSGIDSARSR